MPFMSNGKRDYKKENNWEKTKKPSRIKDRADRRKARKEAGLQKGDPRQADHKKPLKEGGTNDKKNIQVISKKENLHKEALRKQRAAKRK